VVGGGPSERAVSQIPCIGSSFFFLFHEATSFYLVGEDFSFFSERKGRAGLESFVQFETKLIILHFLGSIPLFVLLPKGR
jgi:hypothetical protein